MGTDLFNRYLDRVFVAAQHDDRVMVRAMEVLGRQEPDANRWQANTRHATACMASAKRVTSC